MEQYGNTATYNMESVLRKNIVDSEYYRDTCMKFTSWAQVVDEIYFSVTDVEPWMSGNARGASTAFCLLHRSVRAAKSLSKSGMIVVFRAC
jgi:pre-mRNA-splicing factor 38B